MATELGKAYVQIVPSAQGISGSITQSLGGEADSAGKNAGGKIIGAVKGIIATAAIGKAFGSSLTEGAGLQQSLGGIETLFKDNANTVKKHAEEAYRTTGLSANSYMENVTGFSASLLQSLGGDTAKAASVSNMAMIDMADNSNKMGSSMESIQFAYQGFAKQNYTMLDNLKLGYGGTKQEMERLLADATKLTGVKYDLNSLADVYEAIHVIQSEIGITGTTALEAEETFTGAYNAMKAAAQNTLGALALGEGIRPALEGLAQTVSTFLFRNFIPMVMTILASLPGAIATFIQAIIPELMNIGTSLYEGLSPGLQETFTSIFTTIQESLSSLWSTISPTLTAAMTEIMMTIQTYLPMIKEIFSGAFALIIEVVRFAIDSITTFWITHGSTITSIVSSMWEGIKSIISGALTIIQGIIQTATAILQGDWNGAWEGIKQILQGVWEAIKGIVQIAITAVETIIRVAMNTIQTIISTIWNGIKSITSTVWNAIKSAISSVWDAIRSNISSAINSAKSTIDSAWSAIQSTTSSIWNSIKSAIDSTWNAIKSGVSIAINNVKSTVENVFNSTKSAVSSIWNAIKSAIQDPIAAARDFVKGAIDRMKGFFNFTWSLPKIKLPHFSISGSFSLNPPRVPSFGISWYKEGGIFDSPSIIGVGESGQEAVLPTHKLDKFLQEAVRRVGPVGSSHDGIERIIALLEVILRKNSNVYIDRDKLIGEILDEVDKLLADKQNVTDLAYGGV